MIRGGRNNITSSPAFSNDAKKLLLCTANTVSVFSFETGLKITSLEDHRAPVTSVIVESLPNKEKCYCWTSSLDGKIRLWEFSSPRLLRAFDTHLPIYSMVLIPSHLSQNMIAYVSVESYSISSDSRDLFGQIRRFDLLKHLFDEPLPSGDTLIEMEEPKPLVISPSGELFGVCNSCKIHIWNWNASSKISEDAMAKGVTLHHKELITVFAFHPNKRMLAASDVTGRVLLWKEFDNGEVNVLKSEDDAESCTTLHSHSAEVTGINFSLDGACLYSGGKDGFLVVWELDTGTKQFFLNKEPPFLYFLFSSDPTLASLVGADNQIHLLHMPSMKIVETITGTKPLSSSMPVRYRCYLVTVPFRTVSIDSSCGIAAFPTEDHLVQLYNLFSDREISEVQVCKSSHQQDNDEAPSFVSALGVSRNGSVMVTAEVKLAAEKITEGLVSLKFWVFAQHTKTFSLATVINQPHGEACIPAIALNPVSSMAVSISSAGDFKIWVCSSDENPAPKASKWIVHGTGSYKKRKITAAVFSWDGSILVLAATTIVTVWEPKTSKLLYVFSGKTQAPITELSVTGMSGLIVAASHDSNPQLSVWDVITLGLSWSYRLYIEAIATEVDLPGFAVLASLRKTRIPLKSYEQFFHGKDGAILLFDGSSPKPVAIWTVMKSMGGSISFVVDGKKSQPLLAYVNGSHEYVLFDPFSDEKPETSAMDYEVILAAMSKKKKRPRKKALSVMLERPWGTKFCGSVLNFPPFPDACAAFFSSLMQKRICETVEMQPESHSPCKKIT